MVGIDCVENDNVIVASVRGDWEMPNLVFEHFALDVNHGHEHHVCFVIEWQLLWLFDGVWGCGG